MSTSAVARSTVGPRGAREAGSAPGPRAASASASASWPGAKIPSLSATLPSIVPTTRIEPAATTRRENPDGSTGSGNGDGAGPRSRSGPGAECGARIPSRRSSSATEITSG